MQILALEQWLGTCRFLYNAALEHRITAYQSAGCSINYYDQANELKSIKQEESFKWMAQVHSQVLQDVLKRVDRSFHNFFRGSGFPKWGKKGVYNSFTFPQVSKLEISSNEIRLPKLGWLPLIYHRLIKGRPKQIQVVKQLDHWYICIVCEVEAVQFHGENQAVGIDLGVARLATLSDGTYYENPQHLKGALRQLRCKQRQLARQQKKGKNWYKTLHQIRKLHQKISRCRRDYLHKVSHSISSRYNVVIVEDLKLKNMSSSARGSKEKPGSQVKAKSGLNRSLLDSGMGILLDQLEYKTLHQSGCFHKVNPAYTSQRCSSCGHTCKTNRKSQQVFQCEVCSKEMNADENAAQNILASGTEALPLTWGEARA